MCWLPVAVCAQVLRADGDLFIALDGVAGATRSAPGAVRERVVTVDRDLLKAARVNAGDSRAGSGVLRLNLFEDAVFEAVIDARGLRRRLLPGGPSGG